MNRRVKIITIFVLGLLVFSLYFSAFSQAVLVSDQLVLKAGSNVKGKYLFSNTTVSDLEIAELILKVDRIFTDNATTFSFVQITTTLEVVAGQENPIGLENITLFSYTSIIFEHNRTTLLPAARLYMSNSTYSLEVSVLYLDGIDEMQDFNNANVTYEGSSYIFKDVDPLDPIYGDLFFAVLLAAMVNVDMLNSQLYTPYAINPSANSADTIHYDPTNGVVKGTATMLTSDGNSHDAIHVEYANTFTFGFDDVDEVDAYYETKTGLLIRSIEKDTASDAHFEFVASEIDIQAGLLPFPFLGVVIGIIAIGLTAIFIRKRK